MADPCPLCSADQTALYHRDRRRSYRHCPTCDLVFVPAQFHLGRAEEKAVYDQHENHPGDPGYGAFLSRLFTPINDRLARQSYGLDFGCGPGPVLAEMFAQAGHEVRTFDTYYAPDETVFDATYDFITLSEVAEHLSNPSAEFARLWRCLRPGGWLGVMTKRVRDAQAFTSWHYTHDPTHISFFSEQSFVWLAQSLGGEAPLFVADDVAVIRKTD